MAAFLTFQKFNNVASANAMADLLKENGIETEIENERNYFDVTFSFNQFEANINLKIESQNFEKAHQILEQYFANDINNVEPDYYLLQFSNEELLNIVAKPDEWGAFDYLLAKKLLRERDSNITTSTFEKFKEERITEKAKPATTPVKWIVMGYLFALLSVLSIISYFTGFALVIVYVLSFLKKTLPNGKTVFYYNNEARKHGFIVLGITLTGIIFWVIWFFIQSPHR